MPTERFTRLEREKKRRISEAVILEFQRTPYGEMQISRIAKSARVSRASLYTYFLGKEDMFLFALRQIEENHMECRKEQLIETIKNREESEGKELI